MGYYPGANCIGDDSRLISCIPRAPAAAEPQQLPPPPISETEAHEYEHAKAGLETCIDAVGFTSPSLKYICNS